jgi:S-adenosylmethionine:tRNA ribosyltransferase-isomerase
MNLKTSDFDYDLPQELIAQHPLERRDASRLLVYDRKAGAVEHKHFSDVLSYLNPGDALVINDTRVMPARIIGNKAGTGGRIEFLLLRRVDDPHSPAPAFRSQSLRRLEADGVSRGGDSLAAKPHAASLETQMGGGLGGGTPPPKGDVWEVLAKPAKRAATGTAFEFGGGRMRAEVLEELPEGMRVVRLTYGGVFEEALDAVGSMPLPPYIHEKLADPERYQTVYARERGSAAAPTAGLHFTPELLKEIEAKGINVVKILLHVGLGTFRPVNAENIEEHKMHSEYYEITRQAADAVNKAREAGGRVVAVGTTSARTLETAAEEDGSISPGSGWTDIFIYPGYRFGAVDALLTNFHLPRSTLLMMISAFAGSREKMLDVYKTAVEEKYRFFSFGDAMMIK